MDICHITSVHPRYDIRIFVKECQSLKIEHQISLLVADGLGDELKEEIKIYDLGPPTALSRVKRMRYASIKMYAKILSLKPDIIHFHDPELIPLGLKLTKIGYKVVYDVHEDVPKQILNKLWMPRVFRKFFATYFKYLEKKAAKKLWGIIAATPIIEQRFSKYNSNTLTVFNYPILAEFSNLMSKNYASRKLAVCYIGSISESRGIIQLLESLKLAKFQLKLAGIFSSDGVKNQVISHPLWHKVCYHGVLDRRQISELLAKVQVGVVTLLPTPSYIESLPIKLFEYMLAGIPVIASNFPLWREIIQDCGILVDPLNKDEIFKASEYLLKHPTEAEEMGARGRKLVIEKYNWEAESLKLLQFYREIKD